MSGTSGFMPETNQKESADLQKLEIALGYSFKDRTMLAQALTHKSWAVEQGQGTPDNERLEFLGDAVLELITSDLIYRRHAVKHSEGDMTRMRAFLVNESQLAAQAQRLDIGRHLRLGRGERNSGGSSKPSLLSDAFEAIIGAIYLDGGMDAAFSFVKRILGPLVDDASDALGRDYKSRLQELVQGRMHTVPAYNVENVSGPDHCRTYHVSLALNHEILSQGTGGSKKEAEQQAARRALEILEQVKE